MPLRLELGDHWRIYSQVGNCKQLKRQLQYSIVSAMTETGIGCWRALRPIPGAGWRVAVEAEKNVRRKWWKWLHGSSLGECVGHDRVRGQGRLFQEKETGSL